MKTNILIFIYAALLWITVVFPSTLFSASCIDSESIFSFEPKVDQPSDIALGPNGDMYLVDGVNNRVIVLDKEGEQKSTFGKCGTEQGEFSHPLGIDISKEGMVFIADTRNHRIQVFNLNGDFLYMFTVKTSSDENPAEPADVLASNLKEYLYVSDNDNHKIWVYDQKGTFQFGWGKYGEEYGEFRYPGILATNEFNEIFVVDVLNTRVQKFDPFGKYITEIGSWGVRPGQLYRPKGIAIDKENRVFVTDSYMGVIQTFSDLGKFIGVVCENGRKKRFVTPVGISIDNHNLLSVVEMRANKISVIKLVE